MQQGGTIVRDMPPLPPPPEEERAPPSTPSPTSSSVADNKDKFIKETSSPNNAAAGSTASSDQQQEHGSSVATLSNAWEYDVLQPYCSSCRTEFNPINRRHHCRKCGKIFCNDCSKQRTLIPPSAIVLAPEGGKKSLPQQHVVSFSPDPDPDRMLTYLDENQQLLYGKGLEERFQLAREPLRVCIPCYQTLQPLQEELRTANSNAMRFNHVDPHDPRRFLNSPLAFTLGHEVRKAAYTLNNMLPLPKRMGSSQFISTNTTDNFLVGDARELQQCQEDCVGLSPNLGHLDGVHIPARLLEQAKGIAVLTVVKGGFGLAGIEFGTGLAIARLGENQWSAPCAIGAAGVSWGALIGAQISDHVFLLMTDAAVEIMFNNNGNLQLGADIGVALGPLGRAVEADIGLSNGTPIAPIYTYSLSKGLYAGVSLDGKVIVTRDRVNEKFYGRAVSGMDILSGQIPTPPAARPLYEALQRCHVYATGNIRRHNNPQELIDDDGGTGSGMAYPRSSEMEYGELPEPIPNNLIANNNNNDVLAAAAAVNTVPGGGTTAPQQQQQQQQQQYPPAANDQHSYSAFNAMAHPTSHPPIHHNHNHNAAGDQHSYAGMSDITSDPGY